MWRSALPAPPRPPSLPRSPSSSSSSSVHCIPLLITCIPKSRLLHAREREADITSSRLASSASGVETENGEWKRTDRRREETIRRKWRPRPWPSSTAVHDAEITPCHDHDAKKTIITSSLGKTHGERIPVHVRVSSFRITRATCYATYSSCSIKNAFRYRAPLSRERERMWRGRKERRGRNRSGERIAIEEHEPEMDRRRRRGRKATTRGKKRMEGRKPEEESV